MVIDAPWCSNPRFPSSVPTRPTFGCLPNPSCAPPFGFPPALTPDNNNVFGISSLPGTKIIPAIRFFMDTELKPGTGSKLAPYSPTSEQDESNAEKLIHSISAMPAYMTKSQEELRWEDYELLPNNKCCGSKNCDTLRSQIDTLHSQFETLRFQFQTLCSQFEMFKPKNNLFGPKNNSAVSPFHQTQEPNKNPFGPNSTPFLPPSLFSQPQAFNITNEPFKPNNNPFGPYSTSFPPPSLFSQSEAFNTTNEPFKPNNNPFGPNSTSFPTPSLFSQPQALNTTNEPFKHNNIMFGTTNNNTSPTPNIFALNKHHQTQPFNLPRRLEPNTATCGANDELFHSISAMPGYEAKSHEELRWENYKSLPNNKCCGFKNYATIRSPWLLVPNNNLFGPPSNSTTSATSTTICPGESPFFQNATQTMAFDTTFQLDKPNNNHFGPTINNSSPVQSFISPAPFFTVEPYKPSNNNLFAPTNNNSTTLFPSPQFSPFPFNGPTNTFNRFPPDSQPAENTGIHFFTDSFSQPSQESPSSSTKAAEVGYQNITGQQHQYVPASTVGTKSSIGLSSSPSKVQNKLSSNTRIAPPQQSPRSEPKVALARDEVVRSGPFVPHENADAWVSNSLMSLHSSSDVCEDKDTFQLNIQEAELLSVTSDSHEADVLSLMPKLPDGGEYYTVPSLNELAAKETAEPGSLSRVKEFVVGRFGNGSIKFLGETDVRDLDLGSVLQINNLKVIVYADAKMKPAVGKGMNKAAEVSLLNLKCVSKKTGKQYVDGPQVQSYKEMLIKKGSELGAEFVSYDPVQGEWKFRVQHF